MKKIAFIYLVLLSHKVQGQNQVYTKAEQVSITVYQKKIDKIKLPWGNLGKVVIVFSKNGSVERLRKDSIWGIKREVKNEFIRFYDQKTFKIVDTSLRILLAI